MTPLYAIMHRWASVPFVWGENDCALSLADWWQMVHGTDPAASLRGTYFDMRSCQAACGWFRDPVAVIQGCLDSVGGAPRTEDFKPGDVAVIHHPGEEGRIIPVGALWLGDCWGCKGPNGATTVGPRATAPLAGWSVGYEA